MNFERLLPTSGLGPPPSGSVMGGLKPLRDAGEAVDLDVVQAHVWESDRRRAAGKMRRNSEMRDLGREEVQDLMGKGAQVVEVLAREEFEEDHLPGAINIPLRKIEAEAEGLDKSRPVVLYCWDSA